MGERSYDDAEFIQYGRFRVNNNSPKQEEVDIDRLLRRAGRSGIFDDGCKGRWGYGDLADGYNRVPKL